MDNIDKMVELRNQTRVLKEDTEFKRWVFAHSADESEYNLFMKAIAVVAQFKQLAGVQ